MSKKTYSRRTAVQSLAAVALTGTGATSVAASQADGPSAGTTDSAHRAEQPGRTTQQPIPTSGIGSGLYSGTVDRIVDGEHVVILIEAGGEVVDQAVLSRERYPDLDEGQQVSVLVFWGRVIAIW